MDQELVSRIAATAKSDLQLPDEQLPTIERYVKRAISRILVFCGREDFPPPLEDVAAQIALRGATPASATGTRPTV